MGGKYKAMRTFGSVYIKHPRFSVSAGLWVSYNADPAAHDGSYLDTATLSVETGACVIQTYATADTLRQMAALLMRTADAVDAGVAAAAAADDLTKDAIRAVDENVRHSADSLRALLWKSHPDATDEQIDAAVSRALAIPEAA